MSMYILLAVVVLLFVFSSSQSKKRRRQAESLSQSLEPGVRVLMTSGIFGIVVEVEDDTVVIEISEGVDVRFKKQAVMRVVPHLDEVDDGAAVDGETLDDEALHAELESLSERDHSEHDGASDGKTSLTKASGKSAGEDAGNDGPGDQIHIAEPLDELAKRGRKRRGRGHENGPGTVASS